MVVEHNHRVLESGAWAMPSLSVCLSLSLPACLSACLSLCLLPLHSNVYIYI